MESKNLNYIKHLDGLRGVSILFVVLYHIKPSVFSGGYVGVDVFFVISGFLITSKIVSEDRFNLKNFYLNRFKRLYPATLTVLIITTIFTFIFFTPSHLKDYSQSVISTIFFTSNLLFFTENSYFHSDSLLKPLIHTWSLGIEEQFYLLFPILLIAFKKKWKLILIYITLTSLTISILTVDSYSKANYFLPFFRFWEITVGCLAYIYKDSIYKKLKRLNQLSIFSLFFLFISLFLYNSSTAFPGYNALLIVGSSVLLILNNNTSSLLNKILSNNFLVHIGKLSFTIYLVHQPVFSIYKYLNGTNLTISIAFLLSLLIYFISLIINEYIEKKYRHKKYNIKTKTIISFFTFTLIVFSIIGHYSNGYINRLDNFNLKSTNYSGDRGVVGIGKITNFNDSVVLYGDSFAQQLLPELSSRFGVFYSIQPGCISINTLVISSNKIVTNECRNQGEFFNNASLKSYENFIVSFSWNNIENLKQYENIVKEIKFLSNEFNSKNIIIIGPSPNSNFDGGYIKCLLNYFSQCSNKYLIEKSKNFVWVEYLSKEEFNSNVYFLNLFEIFCDEKFCYETINNNLIYYDGSHSTDFSSKLIVDNLINYINED